MDFIYPSQPRVRSRMRIASAFDPSQPRVRSLMDKASVSEAEDCGFKSRHGFDVLRIGWCRAAVMGVSGSNLDGRGSWSGAPIVQWLEFVPSKHEVRVRFPVGANQDFFQFWMQLQSGSSNW